MVILKKVVSSLMVMSILSITGCATIINSKGQKVNISSSTGEKIKGTINGVPFEGPGIIEFSRTKQEKIVSVDSENCNKQTVVASKVDPVFFINILTGGFTGSTTDYASEKMWRYDENIMIQCTK
jgi:hypothetical protein